MTDGERVREGEAALYRQLGIAADSRIDRSVHRRCSRHLTRLLVRWPVTPNQITVASFAVGLAAAWCVWNASSFWLTALGVLFYGMSVVIDHVDGEVARLTFRESEAGERLDFASDSAVHGLLVLAMGGAAERLAGGGAMGLGAAAAAGVVISATVARLLPRDARRVGTLLRGLGNRNPFYAILIAFSVATTAAPGALPWMLGLLAVGSQAYWLTSLAYRMRASS